MLLNKQFHLPPGAKVVSLGIEATETGFAVALIAYDGPVTEETYLARSSLVLLRDVIDADVSKVEPTPANGDTRIYTDNLIGLCEAGTSRFDIEAERAPNPPIFPIVIALHGHLKPYGVTAILQDGVLKCTYGAKAFEHDIKGLLEGLADLTPDADAAARVVAAAVMFDMGIENDVLAEGLSRAGGRP